MTNAFFAGAQRRVTIGSPTKQSSNGRIVFPIHMPLSGEPLGDLPDWVSEGYAAVAKTFTEISPEVEQIADLAVYFWAEQPPKEMFSTPSVKINSAELKGFRVLRVGDEDDPEVELHFKVFCAYARDFWAWVGEWAGKEVYMAFPANVGTKEDPVLTEQLPLQQETPESPVVAAAPPAGPQPAPRPKRGPGGPKELAEHVLGGETHKKSGPKELAAYHAQQTGKPN